VDEAFPIVLLGGGELFLAAIGLRIAVWVARGWREWREVYRAERPTGPRGPKGGLRLLAGGAQGSAPRLRNAA
jgi:hypothetical protein